MPTIATRLTAQGVLIVNGHFDEVTRSTVGVSIDTVYAKQFDEVSLKPLTGGLAKREKSDGTLQVAGYFDEVTGAH